MATNTNTGDVVTLEEHEAVRSQSLYTKAFARLRRDRLTLVMLGILVLLLIFAYSHTLIEDSFNVSYLRVNMEYTFQPVGTVLYDCNGDRKGEAFNLGAISASVPVQASAAGLVAVASPLPLLVDNDTIATTPQAAGCTRIDHVLGTDDNGRDQLARLAKAGQITMRIAVLAALLSLTIGIVVGIITGYYGGVVDDLIMWFITTLNSIPQLFLLIIIAAVLDPGADGLTLVLGLLGWTGTARLVRGETLGLREREYVVSARALGASDIRIMFNHIMPNLFSVVMVTLAIDIGALILAEATLSFLGFGVEPPEPTWGNMLNGARGFINNPEFNGQHLVIFPGALITTAVLCLYVIGDGIRDAFDPTVND